MFLTKHRNKIIAAVVIIAALVFAWFYGGNFNKAEGGDAREKSGSTEQSATGSNPSSSLSEDSGALSKPSATIQAEQDAGTGTNPDSGVTGERTPQSAVELGDAGGEGEDALGGAGSHPDSDEPDTLRNPQDPVVPAGVSDPVNSNNTADADGQSSADGQANAAGSASAHEPGVTQDTNETPDATPAEPAQAMDINPNTGKDKYQTNPVPDGKPAPAEPQQSVVGDGSFSVTLTVRCDTVLSNMNLLNKEKHELIPDDGVIFPATTVTAYEGESVFNILQREMRRAGIHMTFRSTPIYNSAYIEAINNLYEFDAGELSGWMYCVTPRDTGSKWYPNYGCSRYQLRPGDVVEWNYTCDLGRDLGESAGSATGWQLDE